MTYGLPVFAASFKQDDPVAQCATGVQLFREGQAAEALPLLEAGFAHREETTFAVPNDLGECALALGRLRHSHGKLPEALEANQVALNIFKTEGNRKLQGTTINNIGLVYGAQGRYTEALDSYQQALAIAREVGDRSGECFTLNNIGSLYSDQGRYNEALSSYQHALTICREVSNRTQESTIHNNIGSVYEDQGRYNEALDSYQRALIIAHEVGNRNNEGMALNNIGSVYASQGRYTEALDSVQQALAIHQEMGDRESEAVSLHNIGVIQYVQGQYIEALGKYQQALVIVEEMGNQAGKGTILSNMGQVYEAQGRYTEALDSYQQALVIRREIGHRTGEGITLNNIGTIYQDQGRYAEALDSYQQALAIAREVGNRTGEGDTLHNIGNLYHDQGRYVEALDSYQQAIAIFETIRANAGSEAGRAGFIAQRISTYQAVVNLFYQQGQDEAAFYATEQSRARAFLDSLATGYIQLSDNEAAGLLAQEQELYIRRQALQDSLAQAQAAQPPEPDWVAALEAQLAEAEAAYAAALKAIADRSDQLTELTPGRSQNVLGVPQIQLLLDEQTSLISYFVLDDKTLAFMISHDSFHTFVLEVSRAQLDEQVRTFRDFASIEEAHPENVVTLYNWLIKPLKPYLTTPHLAIIPHSILHYLPFAALTDGQRYLIDEYNLTTLPSGSALSFIQEKARQTAVSGQWSAVILGNPLTGDFNSTASLAAERGSLDALPFAEKEAKAVAALYGVEPLIGEAATESSLREKVAVANILHLATHGFYNPVAPLSSLVALAPDDENDGWLTVGEIYGLDLKNTNLVVLSACQTNLGDLSEGDEVVGLTRAFIFAGTPSVIASLWNVEDQATSLLMEHFYTHLKDGTGKAEALRQAQIEIREKYPHPYYWSAFVLSGDGGEVTDIQSTSIQDTGDTTTQSSSVPAKATPSPSEPVIEEKEISSGCLSLILPLVFMGVLLWQRKLL
ncbi:MAG: CHAT domain-containing protein [Anaerolineae bacterium]|nr:CHAT domain-containing protein [Anaerolineae bacterium]